MSDRTSFTTPADLYIDKKIADEFTIKETIGTGGMGTVYRAVQDVSGRDVAVKLLHRHLIDEDMLVRFKQEARIISKLSHPNIVTVFRYGQTDDGVLYIAMEHVDGSNIAEIIERNGAFTPQAAIPLMIQMADALGFAHDNKVVHRDIKPENILIAQSRRSTTIKLLDFGLAKVIDYDSVRTKTGVLCGSPPYMSPEQWRQDREIDGRVDIYALGCVFYNMLTSTLPFSGDSVTRLMNAHLHEDPINPTEVDQKLMTYPLLVDAILTCIKRDPKDRYANAYALCDDLRKVQMEIWKASGVTESSGSISATPHPVVPKGSADPVDFMEDTLLSDPDSPSLPKQPERQLPESITDSVPSVSPKGGKKNVKFMVGLVVAVIVVCFLGVDLFLRLQDGKEAAGQNEESDLHADKKSEAEKGEGSGYKKNSILVRGVTDDQITFGMSAPFSGPAKELGRNMELGVETWFSVVNDRGGIHGRKLKLVALDDGYDPKKTKKTVVELLDKRNVFGFIGNIGTPTAEVALPVILGRKVLLFGSLTGANLLRKDPPDRYVFNYRASYAEETAAMVDYFVGIKRIPAENIAVFAQNDLFGEDGYRGIVKTMHKYGFSDESKILRVGYERNTIDVEAAVQKVLKHRHDIKAVIMIATYLPASKFIHLIRQDTENVHAKEMQFSVVSFVGSKALAEQFKEIGPQYGKGVIVTQVVPDFTSGSSEVLKYREHLSTYHSEEKPGFISLEGYIAAQVLTHALEKTGRELTTEKLVDAWEKIVSIDLGTGEEIHFGPSRHQGSHKVWGTVLDENAHFIPIDLE